MGKIQKSLRDIHRIGQSTRELLVNPEMCPPLRTLNFTLAGVSAAQAGFRFVRNKPVCGQLLVSFRGIGRVWLDGRWVRCLPGMAYVTPTGPLHAYEAEGRWDVGWIVLTADAPPLPDFRPVLVETDPRPLEHILRGLHHEATTARDPAALASWCQLLRLQFNRLARPVSSSRLWRLWQSVQADFGGKWTLARLARQSSLGAENLRRISLEETGRSPMQHVTFLRMQHAASLLATGRKIEEVALLSGYENAFAFSTTFKRWMRRPPSRFRAPVT